LSDADSGGILRFSIASLFVSFLLHSTNWNGVSIAGDSITEFDQLSIIKSPIESSSLLSARRRPAN
jgi:hypothetical protein